VAQESLSLSHAAAIALEGLFSAAAAAAAGAAPAPAVSSASIGS
jgi:hypothetical protein